ncbi:MAG: helix-turn-helix transcriptional regulator [Muribaculaceae bacterium]|nr:helix-turn-helix transcriptional regulator [Muribaculaceae bacterium]MDE6755450.1 helix-turn-helix transcriptional regulator [Muribaculaceae bacterium]
MTIYNKDSRLSEAVMAQPSLISVIDRLGVTIGVGDESIDSICRKQGIDVAFFLSVVNTFLDEQYFPQNSRDTFSLAKTIDYLEKTDFYYLHALLPNIDRHFSSLMSRSGMNNNLSMLQRFYGEASAQLRDCIQYDTQILYPSLREGFAPEDYLEHAGMHSEVEEKLHDLLYFFVAHLHGDYDHNLCVAVITAVFSLQKDIRQNNRIRRRILIPMIGGKFETPQC